MTNEFLDNAKETLDKIFNLIESKYEKFEVDFEDENLRIDSVDKNFIFIIVFILPPHRFGCHLQLAGHIILKCHLQLQLHGKVPEMKKLRSLSC